MKRFIQKFILKHSFIFSFIITILLVCICGLASFRCSEYYNITFLFVFSFLVDAMIWIAFNWNNLMYFQKKNRHIHLSKNDIYEIRLKSLMPFISLSIALISIMISILTVKSISENMKYIVACIIVILTSALLVVFAERTNEIVFHEFKIRWIQKNREQELYKKINRIYHNDIHKKIVNDRYTCRNIYLSQKHQSLINRIKAYNSHNIVYRIFHKV